MLADTELDNRVLKSQLSKKFPNKVNMGFGVDDNKIKGIDTFPIYDKTTHFRSNARDNVDEFMFTSRQKKYDVSGMKHTSVQEIQPDFFNRHQHGSDAPRTNTHFGSGELSSLYGLPTDRTMTIENPTAQAMNLMGGQMTEEKLKTHIARKEGAAENAFNESAEESFQSFLEDPRVLDIIDEGQKVTGKKLDEGQKVTRKKHQVVNRELAFKATMSKPNQDSNVVVTRAFPEKTPYVGI